MRCSIGVETAGSAALQSATAVVPVDTRTRYRLQIHKNNYFLNRKMFFFA
jgi:hypothetical protein